MLPVIYELPQISRVAKVKVIIVAKAIILAKKPTNSPTKLHRWPFFFQIKNKITTIKWNKTKLSSCLKVNQCRATAVHRFDMFLQKEHLCEFGNSCQVFLTISFKNIYVPCKSNFLKKNKTLLFHFLNLPPHFIIYFSLFQISRPSLVSCLLPLTLPMEKPEPTLEHVEYSE